MRAVTRVTSSTGPQMLDLTKLTPEQRADRQRVIDALRETQGNKAAAARLLGISRVTMWKKVRKYGLDKDQPG